MILLIWSSFLYQERPPKSKICVKAIYDYSLAIEMVVVLVGYSCTILYKKGVDNVATDGLYKSFEDQFPI